MPLVMNMPKIGVNMTEVKVVEWIAKIGDMVKEGDPLFTAETDKVLQEIPSTVSGILSKIIALEGTTIKLKDPVAVFLEEGEEISEEVSFEQSESLEVIEPAQSVNPAKVNESSKIGKPSPGRVRISPLAKVIASEMGIDLQLIKPNQPGERITKADVLKAAAVGFGVTGDNTKASAVDTISYSGTRQTIGSRMLDSVQTKPSVPLTLSVDVTNLVEWRKGLQSDGYVVSYNDLLVYITARALKKFSNINSRLNDQVIELLQDVNIGVAVDAANGLVVPVIREADKKTIQQISEDFQAKLSRINTGQMVLEDISGGTFTITNLGMFEIEQFSPIINPPECAILAVGSIVRQPVVIDDHDTIQVRPVMKLTLVFDHRLVDGGPAAKFLQQLKKYVEMPFKLLN